MASSIAHDTADHLPSRKQSHSGSQRRQNKPLIEKRRRARINQCLLQLKALLTKHLTKQSSRPTKLEKADILEMTVDYIKKMSDKQPEIERGQATDRTQTPFMDGFSRCLEEVDVFLHTQQDLQPEVRHQLLSHCRQHIPAQKLAPEDPSSTLPLARSSSSDEAVREGVKPALCHSSSEDSSVDDSKPTAPYPDDDVTANSAEASPDSSGHTVVLRPFLSHSSNDNSTETGVPFNHTLSPTASNTTLETAVPCTNTCTPTSIPCRHTHIFSSASINTTETAMPFNHDSSPSSTSSRESSVPRSHICSQTSSNMPIALGTDVSNKDSRDKEIQVAGSLRLICGGNVFIVVDQAIDQFPDVCQAQQSSVPAIPGQWLPSGHAILPGNGSSALYTPIYTPNTAGGVTAMSAATLPFTAFFPQSVLAQKRPQYSALVTTADSKSPDSAGLSPFPHPLPEVEPQAENDLNNNRVVSFGHAPVVWRPW